MCEPNSTPDAPAPTVAPPGPTAPQPDLDNPLTDAVRARIIGWLAQASQAGTTETYVDKHGQKVERKVSYRNSLRAMRELAGYQRLALERKRADYRDKVDA